MCCKGLSGVVLRGFIGFAVFGWVQFLKHSRAVISENIGMFVVFHAKHLRTSDCIGNNFPTAAIGHIYLNLKKGKITLHTLQLFPLCKIKFHEHI